MMERRFDHVYRDFEMDGVAMAGHASSSVKAYRLARCSAYRMAVNYLILQKEYHNQLLELVKGQAFKTIDEWIDKWFDPYVMIEGDVRALINAVNDGMSVKEYLAGSPRFWLSNRKKGTEDGKVGAVHTLPPVVGPPGDSTPEEKSNYWKDRAEMVEADLKDARREISSLKRRNMQLEGEWTKAMRRLGKLVSSAA